MYSLANNETQNVLNWGQFFVTNIEYLLITTCKAKQLILHKSQMKNCFPEPNVQLSNTRIKEQEAKTYANLKPWKGD